MKTGVAIAIIVAIALPGMARAQSSIDAEPVILLHPGVPTILQLPDEIQHARVLDREEFRVAVVGDELLIRPWPGTPTGVEALLEVRTRTTRQTFQLRVVAHARDANRNIRVPLVDAPAPEEETPPARPEEPAEPEVPAKSVEPPKAPAETVTRSAAKPAASEPSPAPAEPELTSARANMTAMSSRLDLSVHAIVGFGATALDLAGWDPTYGRQAHNAFGMRVAGLPHGAWWALETDVSAEWSRRAMEYEQGEISRLAMNGPWLRAEVGLRARLETESQLIPSAFVRIGLQAHLRHAQTAGDRPERSMETMPYGAALAGGIGVQYRVHDLVLGLDFQARRGGPDDYFSVAALWTTGYILGQGDEP